MRALPIFLIPQRLHGLVAGASGRNNLSVWSMGEGTFSDEPVSATLTLRVDAPNRQHGLVEPNVRMRVEDYQSALAATRQYWKLDED